MPRRPPPASPKDRCHATYKGAREADTKMAATYDRWWSETLVAIDGKPEGTRTEMLRRTAILFEILVDRRTWLAGRMR
jgi:hypothetical protein